MTLTATCIWCRCDYVPTPLTSDEVAAMTRRRMERVWGGEAVPADITSHEAYPKTWCALMHGDHPDWAINIRRLSRKREEAAALIIPLTTPPA